MENSYAIIVYRNETDFRKYNAIAHTLENGYWQIHTAEGQVLFISTKSAATVILDKRFKEILKEVQNAAQVQTQS